MSMTSPRTTLTRGQYAPLLHRSSAAPHSTLPQRKPPEFLRRDLRQRADYFANPSIERTLKARWPQCACLKTCVSDRGGRPPVQVLPVCTSAREDGSSGSDTDPARQNVIACRLRGGITLWPVLQPITGEGWRPSLIAQLRLAPACESSIGRATARFRNGLAQPQVRRPKLASLSVGCRLCRRRAEQHSVSVSLKTEHRSAEHDAMWLACAHAEDLNAFHSAGALAACARGIGTVPGTLLGGKIETESPLVRSERSHVGVPARSFVGVTAGIISVG